MWIQGKLGVNLAFSCTWKSQANTVFYKAFTCIFQTRWTRSLCGIFLLYYLLTVNEDDAGLEVSFSGDSVRFGVFKSRPRILKPGSRSLAVSNLQFFTIIIDQVPAWTEIEPPRSTEPFSATRMPTSGHFCHVPLRETVVIIKMPV